MHEVMSKFFTSFVCPPLFVSTSRFFFQTHVCHKSLGYFTDHEKLHEQLYQRQCFIFFRVHLIIQLRLRRCVILMPFQEATNEM